MRLAERNMIQELAEQLEHSNILLREGLMMAIDLKKKDLISIYRNTYHTNEKKLARAAKMIENYDRNN